MIDRTWQYPGNFNYRPVSRKAYISWRSRVLFCIVCFLSNSFLKGNFSVLYTIVTRNHGLSLLVGTLYNTFRILKKPHFYYSSKKKIDLKKCSINLMFPFWKPLIGHSAKKGEWKETFFLINIVLMCRVVTIREKWNSVTLSWRSWSFTPTLAKGQRWETRQILLLCGQKSYISACPWCNFYTSINQNSTSGDDCTSEDNSQPIKVRK